MKVPPLPEVERTCPYCREKVEVSDAETLQRIQKSMSLGDAGAFARMAACYICCELGLARDMEMEYKLLLRAIELGSAGACLLVARHYGHEHESLGHDCSMSTEYLIKVGAKRGHIDSRYYLGLEELDRGNIELAVKHLMISAAAGHDDSLKLIRWRQP